MFKQQMSVSSVFGVHDKFKWVLQPTLVRLKVGDNSDIAKLNLYIVVVRGGMSTHTVDQLFFIHKHLCWKGDQIKICDFFEFL